MKELDDVEAASIINNGFMMAHTNRFDTVRFMTNLLEIVRNDGRIRNANRSVTFSKKQPKRTKLQATIA